MAVRGDPAGTIAEPGPDAVAIVAEGSNLARSGRILVVDDNVLMRGRLICLLGRVGHNDVPTADSGISTFALLGLDNEKPLAEGDLILMDLVLPDTDGIAMIRIPGAHERQRNIPVIMVTAMQEKEGGRAGVVVAGAE